MTREEREEAIINIKRLWMMSDLTDEYGDMLDSEPFEKSVKMAIKALEQEPCDAINREDALKCFEEFHQTETLAVGYIRSRIRQLPSVTPKPTMRDRVEKEYLLESIREDLEKLQAENDKLRKQIEPCDDAISRAEAICLLDDEDAPIELIYKMNVLPSVTSGRHKGHWIREVDFGNCLHYVCSECENEGENSDYCPYCGAEMEKMNERTI